MHSDSDLSEADLARATAHGLAPEEVRRQLGILRAPPPSIELDRACQVGDGVAQIRSDDEAPLLAAHARAADAGRATYFVPASGAATRMFKALLAVRAGASVSRPELDRLGDADAKIAARFFDHVHEFAFAGELAAALAADQTTLDACVQRGEVRPVLDALLRANGLGLAERPKGLIPFHRYADGSRTAFEDHLVEAAALAAASDGAMKLHFTVSAEHEEAFADHLASVRGRVETTHGVRLNVGFSTQKSSTDTVAVDDEGRPFRDDAGELLFRPGGHGSLIANLGDLGRQGADLVFVKNIDNVVHDDWRTPVLHWRRLLAGRLVVLQERLFGAARELDEPDAPGDAVTRGAAVLRDELGIEVDATREAVRTALNRPTRVCAVLRAEGDPGGGPFWVRDAAGHVSPQIVETAQIDQTSEAQRGVQATATHFSPADMVLGLRDHRGDAYDLAAHVDPEAVFVAEKSSGGRALRALEHPGLWNGGMSDWNTLFVEVAPEIFHPVKALTDLLAPAHQPAG